MFIIITFNFLASKLLNFTSFSYFSEVVSFLLFQDIPLSPHFVWFSVFESMTVVGHLSQPRRIYWPCAVQVMYLGQVVCAWGFGMSGWRPSDCEAGVSWCQGVVGRGPIGGAPYRILMWSAWVGR